MIKYLTGLYLAACLTAPAMAQTQEPAPWYRVDLMVFAQPGNHLEDENWDTSVFPKLSGQYLDLGNPEQNSQAPETLIESVSNSIQLPANSTGLRSRGYEILFTRSWEQKMLPREQTLPIRIQAGDPISDTFTRLDGEISLDIARYLHLRTRLYYSIPVSADWLASHTPTTKLDPVEASNPFMDIEDNTVMEVSPIMAGQQVTSQSDPAVLTVKMEQGRRMRGDELHYLDHPYFGLLIKMTRLEKQPVTPPPEEVMMEPAEENTTEAQLSANN